MALVHARITLRDAVVDSRSEKIDLFAVHPIQKKKEMQ